MLLDEFLNLLKIAVAKGYDFRTSTIMYFEESLTTGLLIRRWRRPIFHVREEKRSLEPMEAVAHCMMKDGVIPKEPVHHPLIAAEKIGLPRNIAHELLKAACDSPEGCDRNLRARILRACNLPVF